MSISEKLTIKKNLPPLWGLAQFDEYSNHRKQLRLYVLMRNDRVVRIGKSENLVRLLRQLKSGSRSCRIIYDKVYAATVSRKTASHILSETKQWVRNNEQGLPNFKYISSAPAIKRSKLKTK